MKSVVFFLALLISCISADAQLVPFTSLWRYYDAGSAPPNQSGDNWKEITYDHSAWSEGPAQLGFGDGDEATITSSAAFTTYFRHTFHVDDPLDFSGIDLQLIYDDGAVVYLNGTEVWRVNMPTGNINYGTNASGSSGDNAVANTTLANTLITGTNIVSVEIHQHTSTSTDISFDLRINGILAGGVAAIVRGPYLQRASPTSMTLKWRTNIPTESILDYGLNTTSLSQSVNNMTLKTDHSLTVNSLTAATKYFYQVRNTNDTLLFPSTGIYFKTHPSAGSTTPLTAWILGDCGTGNANARSVRDAYYNYIGSQHTDMMLFLGDNAYNDGLDSEYQTALFQDMYEHKLKNTIAWSCLGNHDGHSANSNTQSGPYYDIFTFPKNGECGGIASNTEAYYSFDHGNVHFIILDSYETNTDVGAPMYAWCEDDLMATNADWIIAMWHHPAYSKGSHDSDTESQLFKMRQNFLPLLESYGVDLVLSGHSHSYERTFLLNGHYGMSSTFDIEDHTVGLHGSGSGKLSQNVPYYKAPVGPEGGDGAVYVTTGSAGKTSSGAMNHPAMYYDAISLGSCVLKINQDTLSLIYLRQTGAIDDVFTLIKDPDCVPGTLCNDQNSCTHYDAYDNNCLCRGTPDLRRVSTTADAGIGSLRDAIAGACEGDTILFMPSVTDTIRLSGQIILNKDLVIICDALQDIVISGQHQTRIFHIQSNAEIVLNNITLYGGNNATDGGAILNDGMLILDDVRFVNNYQGAQPRSWTNNNEIRIRTGETYLITNE